MDNILQGALSGAIIGGVVGGVIVVLMALFGPKRKCPECGEAMPKMRKPANKRQMLWGGWTCPNCGCEIDRKGKRVDPE